MRAAAVMTAALVAAGCGGDALLSFLPACPDGETALFTTAPIADGDFTGLMPLGGVSPPGHVFPGAEIAFAVPKGGGGVPLVAPGAVTLWRVESRERLGAAAPRRDYVLRFAPCANVSAYFNHVETLDPALAARLGPLDAGCSDELEGDTTVRTCGKTVRVDLTAGAPLGTTGGGDEAPLEFGLGDNRLAPLPYADKTRDDFDPLHAACPVDYFEAAVGDAMRARFSDASGTRRRTAAPVCGEIAQDIAGTAQGRWFLPDSARSTPEAPHLALVHDNVDPTVPVFSVGTSMPGFTGTWTFTPAATGTIGRDFGVVAPGAVYCWNVTAWPAVAGSPAWMVAAYMPDSARLRIGARSGARCEETTTPIDDVAIELSR